MPVGSVVRRSTHTRAWTFFDAPCIIRLRAADHTESPRVPIGRSASHLVGLDGRVQLGLAQHCRFKSVWVFASSADVFEGTNEVFVSIAPKSAGGPPPKKLIFNEVVQEMAFRPNHPRLFTL